MASFWDVLGGIAGGVAEVLDPTPGNVLSGGVRTVGRVLTGGGGGSVQPYPVDSRNLPMVRTPETSTLGWGDYLVPDVIERQIGTLVPAGTSCAPGPVITAPMQAVRLKAPPGYRIVECPKGSGQKVAMREETARAYGYIRPRRRPPISVKDWTALKRADRTARKLDRVVQMSNRVTGKARYRRSSGRSASVSCSATTRTRKR